MEFHFEETFERLEDILRYLILMLLDNKDFDPTTGPQGSPRLEVSPS